MKKSFLSALAAFTLIVTMSGCGDSIGILDDGGPDGRRHSESHPDKVTVEESVDDRTAQVKEMRGKYPDTVGWLSIPGTSIDDIVLFDPEDQTAYERSDRDGEYDFNGEYYADYRSVFGNGGREGLGMNTCVYGHAMTDNEEREQYAIRFGPLHDFRSPEYAKSMPYIQFSTGDENLVFEVFAVFAANSDNPALPYNRNDIPPAEFIAMIKNEVLPRSLYDYGNMTFSESDKFLTLSTCIYTMPDGTRLDYENSEMRYAVMAKLLETDAPLKNAASFVENMNVVLDPDGSWPKAAA